MLLLNVSYDATPEQRELAEGHLISHLIFNKGAENFRVIVPEYVAGDGVNIPIENPSIEVFNDRTMSWSPTTATVDGEMTVKVGIFTDGRAEVVATPNQPDGGVSFNGYRYMGWLFHCSV